MVRDGGGGEDISIFFAACVFADDAAHPKRALGLLHVSKEKTTFH